MVLVPIPARYHPFVNDPLAYFITWTGRGTWLHGDDRGSIHRDESHVGQSLCEPNPKRVQAITEQTSAGPHRLTNGNRAACERAVREVCKRRGWHPHAVTVRSNHAHVVVTGNTCPERIMQQLKAWSTRAVRKTEPGFAGWTRHGSTRYLWNQKSLEAAIKYVLEQDGPRAHARGSERSTRPSKAVDRP